MKEFIELEQYIRSIPQNKILEKDMIIRKIREKSDEFLVRDKLQNTFFQRATIEIQEGDLVVFNVSGLDHPAIVIRVNENSVDAVILSTKDKDHSITQIKQSRMFPDSYVTCTIANLEKESAKKRWFGVFDVPSELKRIKRELKIHYSKLFKDAGKQTEKKEDIVQFVVEQK